MARRPSPRSGEHCSPLQGTGNSQFAGETVQGRRSPDRPRAAQRRPCIRVIAGGRSESAPTGCREARRRYGDARAIGRSPLRGTRAIGKSPLRGTRATTRGRPYGMGGRRPYGEWRALLFATACGRAGDREITPTGNAGDREIAPTGNAGDHTGSPYGMGGRRPCGDDGQCSSLRHAVARAIGRSPLRGTRAIGRSPLRERGRPHGVAPTEWAGAALTGNGGQCSSLWHAALTEWRATTRGRPYGWRAMLAATGECGRSGDCPYGMGGRRNAAPAASIRSSFMADPLHSRR